MKKYLIEITETLQKQIEVQANSREEAEQKIREQYRNEEIVLDDTNYVDTEFTVLKEKEYEIHGKDDKNIFPFFLGK